MPGHLQTDGQRKVTTVASQWDTLVDAWETRNSEYGGVLPHPAEAIAAWREKGQSPTWQTTRLYILYGVDVAESTLRTFDVEAAS